MNTKILKIALISKAIIILVAILGYNIIGSMVMERAKQLSVISLREKSDLTETYFGYEIEVKFQTTEEKNTSIANCKWGSVSSVDYNKSKLIGEFVGSRSKEFAKGLWDGVRNK